MSDFVQQQGTVCEFGSSDSWVILSPIEQSIKRKINAVGTPLKDWDIQINYGIKTGCNEAFIVSTEKRDEILANCQTEEERQRTAELIRPILRGRDIKRYSYEWANLWLIATFPSRHYDIDKFPSVKAHLESYYDGHGNEVLEQTGAIHIINGEKVKSRKKTSNKWFETQDSISYWEDFSQPKIIWKRIGSKLRFSYDNNGTLGLDSTCFATGHNVQYLCCLLNSKMGKYLLKDSPKTGTGDLIVSVQAIEPVMAACPIDTKVDELLNAIITNNNQSDIDRIDHIFFSLYNLSNEEITYVSNYIRQFE